MQVSSVGNQNFGRIFVDKEKRAELLDKLLKTPAYSSNELKETIADIVDIALSKDRAIYVRKDGTIEYLTPHTKGKTYRDSCGQDLAGTFIHALNRMRSDELRKKVDTMHRCYKFSL